MFSDNDKASIIKLLNMVATKATFTVNVNEMLEFTRLLRWAQVDLVPKIDSHIVEIVKYTPKEETEAQPPQGE
jgi:hypothetical protein